LLPCAGGACPSARTGSETAPPVPRCG
jgi:hypothetical protein